MSINIGFLYSPIEYKNSHISVTTENAANGFSKKKLANFNPEVKYRTTAITNQIVEIDTNSFEDNGIDYVYIGGSNFVTGDTVWLRGGNVSGVAIGSVNMSSFLTSTPRDFAFPIAYTVGQSYGWKYRYYWLDITKGSGSYAELGSFVLFRKYSDYQIRRLLNDPSPVPDDISFRLDNLEQGGRQLNYDNRGYENKIPFSSWIEKNVYSSVPVYNTPVVDIRPVQRKIIQNINESSYLHWFDWSGGYFGTGKIDNIQDVNAAGDKDLQLANGTLTFSILRTEPT